MTDSDAQNNEIIFRSIDTDKSGQITIDELRNQLRDGFEIPFNEETIILIIKIYDKNHNGTINAEEFKVLRKQLDIWRKVFNSIDTNNSGDIDKDELTQSLFESGNS